MKRYYVSQIVGDGSNESPFQPRVADYPVSWVGAFFSDAQGMPMCEFCLCLVNADDHADLLNDPGVIALPDVALSTPMEQVETVELFQALNAVSVDTTGQFATFGDFLRHVGEQCNPVFDLNMFDVQ